MNRCRTCQHWRSNGEPQIGTCRHHKELVLTTHEDSYCINQMQRLDPPPACSEFPRECPGHYENGTVTHHVPAATRREHVAESPALDPLLRYVNALAKRFGIEPGPTPTATVHKMLFAHKLDAKPLIVKKGPASAEVTDHDFLTKKEQVRASLPRGNYGAVTYPGIIETKDKPCQD